MDNLMRHAPINNEPELTETEDNSDDEIANNNVYKFISTQIRNNDDLKNYLDNILGWYDKEDTEYVDDDYIWHHIYSLLDDNGKKIIKTNYEKDIRRLTRNDNFTFR